MTRQILYRPRAKRDLIEIVEYIGSDRPTAARRFLKQVSATLESLARFPGIGRLYETTHPALQGIRVTSVASFRNYLLFYRANAESIELLAVIHGARDLPNLLDRLADQEFN